MYSLIDAASTILVAFGRGGDGAEGDLCEKRLVRRM
jgi:hypothetical protein